MEIHLKLLVRKKQLFLSPNIANNKQWYSTPWTVTQLLKVLTAMHIKTVNVITTLTVNLLLVRHCSKHFMYINSFNNSVGKILMA